jgi:hypothetical protein
MFLVCTYEKLEINIIRRIRFKGECLSGLKGILRCITLRGVA